MRKISISSKFSCMKVDEYLHMFIGCYGITINILFLNIIIRSFNVYRNNRKIQETGKLHDKDLFLPTEIWNDISWVH